MSTFTPTSIRFDPPEDADKLGSALLRSLGRELSTQNFWGPIKTVVIGAISFGFVPLLFLPRRLRTLSMGDQLLIAYARQRLDNERSDEIPQPPEPFVIKLAAVVGIAAIIIAITAILVLRLTFADLWAATYGFYWLSAERMTPLCREIHAGWIWFLSIAYLIHFIAAWRAVRLIAPQLKTAPRIFDARLILWFLCAAPLVYAGTIWSLPMMLAVGVQRRYITGCSIAMRRNLSDAIAQARQRYLAIVA